MNHGAVLGADGLNHIGLHQIAPVNHRGKGGDHLKGRHLHALAEGGHRQVHPGHHIPVPDVALGAGLAGQVHAGLLLQPEGLEIIIKGIHTQPLSDGDKRRVAGVLHRLGQGLGAVPLPSGAVDGLVIAGHHHRARTGKGVAL